MKSSEREQWSEWYENRKNSSTVQAAKLERDSGNGYMAKKGFKGLDSRCNIHLHSRRHRLIDLDNLSAKACIDGLRHSGFLRDDGPQEINQVIHTQEKVPNTEEEGTVITISDDDTDVEDLHCKRPGDDFMPRTRGNWHFDKKQAK